MAIPHFPHNAVPISDDEDCRLSHNERVQCYTTRFWEGERTARPTPAQQETRPPKTRTDEVARARSPGELRDLRRLSTVAALSRKGSQPAHDIRDRSKGSVIPNGGRAACTSVCFEVHRVLSQHCFKGVRVMEGVVKDRMESKDVDVTL